MEILESIIIKIPEVLVSAGIVTWYIKAYIKNLLQKDHSKYVEKLKYDIRVREQAASVAEYLALLKSLPSVDVENKEPEKFLKANHLSWELAMWLP